MPSSLILLLALVAAFKLADRIVALVTDTLATSIAFVLCLRDARDGRDLSGCAMAPHRLAGKHWHKDRREQRLLERATRNAVSITEFITQHPQGSARGKSLADRLRKRGHGQRNLE